MPPAGPRPAAHRPQAGLPRGGLARGALASLLVAAGFAKLGLDLKGDLTVGWWFEGIRGAPATGPSFHEWVAGIDYTFDVRDGLTLAVQHYYDGSGAASPAAYDFAGLAQGRRRTLGTRYWVASASLRASATWTCQLDLIRNGGDGTGILSPTAVWRIDDDLQLNFGANLYLGERGGER